LEVTAFVAFTFGLSSMALRRIRKKKDILDCLTTLEEEGAGVFREIWEGGLMGVVRPCVASRWPET
jgi:hypothetical protein